MTRRHRYAAMPRYEATPVTSRERSHRRSITILDNTKSSVGIGQATLIEGALPIIAPYDMMTYSRPVYESLLIDEVQNQGFRVMPSTWHKLVL